MPYVFTIVFAIILAPIFLVGSIVIGFIVTAIVRHAWETRHEAVTTYAIKGIRDDLKNNTTYHLNGVFSMFAYCCTSLRSSLPEGVLSINTNLDETELYINKDMRATNDQTVQAWLYAHGIEAVAKKNQKWMQGGGQYKTRIAAYMVVLPNERHPDTGCQICRVFPDQPAGVLTAKYASNPSLPRCRVEVEYYPRVISPEKIKRWLEIEGCSAEFEGDRKSNVYEITFSNVFHSVSKKIREVFASLASRRRNPKKRL